MPAVAWVSVSSMLFSGIERKTPLSLYGLAGVPGLVMSLPLVLVYQAPISMPDGSAA